MATPFSSFVTGLQSAQDKQRLRDQEKAALAEQQQTKELQRQAMMLGIQNQQTAAQDRLDAKTAGQTRLGQRVQILRRNPALANYGDEELAGLAGDDAAYQKVLMESFAKPKKAVAFDNKTGKPTVYDADNPEFPEGFVGPHAQEPKATRDPVADFISKLDYERGHPKPQAGGHSRSLPSSAVEKITGLDAMETQAIRVRDAIKTAIANKTDATGRALGGLVKEPGWLMNLRGKGGEEGENLRTDIGNLFSTIAKERGGTALSNSELDLLESYVPNKNDDEGTAYRKSVKFIQALQDIKKAKLSGYQKYGYGVDDEAPPVDRMETGSITVNGKTFKVPE